jgi:hypothetical protein
MKGNNNVVSVLQEQARQLAAARDGLRKIVEMDSVFNKNQSLESAIALAKQALKEMKDNEKA